MLENPGTFPSRRIRADSPGAGLLADTKQGPQALSPGEGHRERLFCQLNCLLSLLDNLGQSCPEGLATGRQPARRSQGE